MLSTTLNFASTTGAAVGETVDCGAGSNMYRDTAIASVTATTLVVQDEAFGTVPSAKACTVHLGARSTAVAGTYTLTATNGTTFNLTAPSGGHSQTGVVIASNTLTFTDLAIPFTGTPVANDNWTIVIPAGSTANSIEGVDRANSIALPSVQPPLGTVAPTAGIISTNNGFVGIGQNPITNNQGNAFSLFSSAVALHKTTAGNAGLPVCASVTEGAEYSISDSNTATFNAIIVSSGSLHVIAYCNGSNWVVH